MTTLAADPRAETIAKIERANETAKQISRRGRAATMGNLSYEDAHACIDWLLGVLGY